MCLPMKIWGKFQKHEEESSYKDAVNSLLVIEFFQSSRRPLFRTVTPSTLPRSMFWCAPWISTRVRPWRIQWKRQKILTEVSTTALL
jgi:hypothetical protein